MGLFEEKLAEINQAISAKRGLWQLGSISYMDYDDVAQILRTHIAEKIHSYDESRPFAAWVSVVITHRIRNLIRDNYGKLAPPCGDCPFNNGNNLCQFTCSGFKDSSCDQYANWEKRKRSAYELKLAAPLEDHDGGGHSPINFDVEKSVGKFHAAMEKLLSKRTYEAYTYLYIEGLSEEETVKKMGFKETKEKGRLPGYRQLTNIKNEIKLRADELIKDFDLEY
jgi:DNA-directed RNA polymerase specialized sigma24 family protein